MLIARCSLRCSRDACFADEGGEIGDAAPDMEAGRRAGVQICAVKYGYGNIEDMKKFEPDYWISDLRELSATTNGSR